MEPVDEVRRRWEHRDSAAARPELTLSYGVSSGFRSRLRVALGASIDQLTASAGQREKVLLNGVRRRQSNQWDLLNLAASHPHRVETVRLLTEVESVVTVHRGPATITPPPNNSLTSP